MRSSFGGIAAMASMLAMRSAVDMSSGNGSGLPSLSPSALSEYDFYVLIDSSGSMDNQSTRYKGKNRWDEAKELTQDLTTFAANTDDDGIDIITFSSSHKVFSGVKADGINAIFNEIKPNGGTRLAAPLKAAFDLRKQNGKPGFVFVITDGTPSDRSEVANLIISETNSLSADKDMTILFVQVGNDPEATEFLTYLDDNLQSNGAKFDIVDTISAPDAERMEIGQMLYKAQND